MQRVSIRVDTVGIPHVFIHEPDKDIGHHAVVAVDAAKGGTVPGMTKDDSKHDWDSETSIVDVCPETKAALDKSIDMHSKDDYNYKNNDARNCVGWALGRYQDANLPTKFSPDKRGLYPADLVDNYDSYPGDWQ